MRAVFVRRTFSASVIILWHSKSWWNQSYPQNSDVCTIVRTLYLNWIKRYPQDWSYTRLPDLVNNGTIYSWRNLTASNSNQTRSTFVYKLEQVWSFGRRHLNNFEKSCYSAKIILKHKTANTTWTNIQIQDSSFSFC